MTKLTETEKQELAERIAKKRGYVKAGIYLSCVCIDVEFPHDPHREAGEEIFGDSQFLPMVREAEAKGWRLITNGKYLQFYAGAGKLTDDSEIGGGLIEKHGYMIALCLAFDEIPEDSK